MLAQNRKLCYTKKAVYADIYYEKKFVTMKVMNGYRNLIDL